MDYTPIVFRLDYYYTYNDCNVSVTRDYSMFRMNCIKDTSKLSDKLSNKTIQNRIIQWV